MNNPDPDPVPAPERDTDRMRLVSTPGKLAALFAAGLLLFAAQVFAGRRWTELPEWLVWLSAFGITLVPVVWIAGRFVRRLVWTLEGLSNGIRSFQDRDFSMRIPYRRNDELGDLVRLYNRVGELLQEERAQIRQRELLLQSALDQSPIAIVLVNPLQRVVYDNAEARRLFMGGSKLGGRQFGEILAGCPDEMRQVLKSDSDGIFTVEAEGELETYHLARREFFLNRRKHALYLLRHMTAELARQEVEIWKKVIRIISHELNNSLAPISSLAHSGALIARQPDQVHRLEPIYATIRERVEHLTSFLEGYARFARLPKPTKQEVEWSAWLAGPRKMYAFETSERLPPTPGWFDPSQMQQVLINLLKNAAEATEGDPEISVQIQRMTDGVTRVQVGDRGRGMNDEVMRQALLPFYSTKQSGAGIGLPLCREIIEAHGGSMRIQGRSEGGTLVSFWLPPRR